MTKNAYTGISKVMEIMTREMLKNDKFVLFLVIPLRLNFIIRRFGTICLFHLHSWCMQLTPPMKLEQCSETSSRKIQAPSPSDLIQNALGM
jgi:hypothetical protein